MKIYWSPTFLATAADIRTHASALDVDPIAKPFDRNSFVILKQLLSGDVAENTVGHNTVLSLVVSADQMPIMATIGVNTKTIENWLYDWEEALFRWVQIDELDADPVRVKMTAKPNRTRIDNDDDLLQFEYSLVTSPFVVR